jgi:hypothetical protein
MRIQCGSNADPDPKHCLWIYVLVKLYQVPVMPGGWAASVADLDPGSGAFYPPDPGFGMEQWSDPG